jgi:hypothetical protein
MKQAIIMEIAAPEVHLLLVSCCLVRPVIFYICPLGSAYSSYHHAVMLSRPAGSISSSE